MDQITSDLLNILVLQSHIVVFLKSIVVLRLPCSFNDIDICHSFNAGIIDIHFLFFVSIAIGREGGVVPLIALARSEAAVSIYFIFSIIIRNL